VTDVQGSIDFHADMADRVRTRLLLTRALPRSITALSIAIVASAAVCLIVRFLGTTDADRWVWTGVILTWLVASLVDALRHRPDRLRALVAVDRFYHSDYLVPSAWELLAGARHEHPGQVPSGAAGATIAHSMQRLRHCDPDSVVPIVIPRRIVALPIAIIAAVLLSYVSPEAIGPVRWEGPAVAGSDPEATVPSPDDPDLQRASELQAARGALETRPRGEEAAPMNPGELPTLDPTMRRLGTGELLDTVPGGESYEGELLSRGILRTVPDESSGVWRRPPRGSGDESVQEDQNAADGRNNTTREDTGNTDDEDDAGDDNSGSEEHRPADEEGGETTEGRGGDPGTGPDDGTGQPQDPGQYDRLSYAPFDLPMNTAQTDHSELVARAAPQGETVQREALTPLIYYEAVQARIAERAEVPIDARRYVRDYFLELGQ